MMDPPREDVANAVSTCRKAGIRTVMITGDHLATAQAIATEIGIFRSGDKAMTGAELDKLPQSQLEEHIYEYTVYARVSPEHSKPMEK